MKTNKTISIDTELADEIKSRNINFSEWVEEMIRSSFGNPERNLEEEEQKLKKQLEETSKKLKVTKEEAKRLKEEAEKPLTQEEAEFFREALAILTRDISFMDGQIKKYRSLFGKDITREKIMEVCKLENGKT